MSQSCTHGGGTELSWLNRRLNQKGSNHRQALLSQRIRHYLGRILPHWGRRGEVGGNLQAKRSCQVLLLKALIFTSYFADIGLDVEGPMVEATPPLKKRKKAAPEKMMGHKYPRARKVFTDLTPTHTPGELQDLLTASLDFSELGIFKIETLIIWSLS